MKAKNRVRPVTMSEIVGGQTYLELTVCFNGDMFLQNHVFYGRPVKDREIGGAWRIRTQKGNHRQDKRLDAVSNFVFASDAGLDPQRQTNLHRTFRANMQNRQILKDLVRRQDLVGYLQLIGIADPEKVAETKRNTIDLDFDFFDFYDYGDEDFDEPRKGLYGRDLDDEDFLED